MARTEAEDFKDYIDQSLAYNRDFIEEVENAIHENLPTGKSLRRSGRRGAG